MRSDDRRFILATATLIGTIIGVGIFGVPYALSKVGVGLGVVYFVVLGGIQLLQHLFYAEAAIACPDKLRLAGLTERYLGKKASALAMVSTTLGYWGGMLAYILVGGTFLHVLLSPYLGGAEFHYQLAWAVGGAAVIYFGLGFVSRVSFVATLGLLVAMLAILGYGLPHVRPDHLPWFTGHDLFLPYGVVLFSLSGLPAILEMEDILAGKHARYRRAIVAGSLVAAALTAAFGFVVLGVTGPATTPDAIVGLKSRLGGGIAVLGAAFGFLAVSTSYFGTAINLRGTFLYDAKLSKVVAWLMTVAAPILVFLLGAQNFVTVVSFSGAVFGGIGAVLVALLYVNVTKKKLMKEKPLGIPVGFAYVSIAILTLGAVWELATSAKDLLG